ncbi:aminotransferase [Demequina salsinemoris]|uniref:aminotransferase n=1 Tax=Demequina salsinemoris TaxID=577470 RepID=UPI0007833840|nr:aminotransferase [Demequina salsinemoris]
MSTTHQPAWDEARAEAIARDSFGIDVGAVRRLGSNEDLNALVTATGGARYVLKISHGGIPRDSLDAQNAALVHLRDAATGLSVPLPLPATDGALVQTLEWGGEPRAARLLEFVEGHSPTTSARLSEDTAARVGAAAGRITAALADFTHPGLAGGGDWDLREAARVIREARGHLDDTTSAAIESALDGSLERLAERADALRVQAVHGDVTGDNLVGEASGTVEGVIDFGDLGLGWVVAEVAIVACSLFQHDGDAFGLALAAIEAFDREMPLTDAEIEALWPAVRTRAAVLVASGGRVLADDPGNTYAAVRAPLERRMLERALETGLDEAELLIRHRLGRLAGPPRPLGAIIGGLGTAPVLDLSVASSVHDAGAFLDPGNARAELLVLARRDGTAVTAYGVPSLTPEAGLAGAPDSVELAVEAAVVAGTPVVAPAEGLVRVGDELVIVLDDGTAVRLTGVDPAVADGDRVGRGDLVGTVVGEAEDEGDHRIVSVQGVCHASLVPPRRVRPSRARAWREICPDPAALLGRVPAPEPDAEPADLIARRDAAFARVQEHYYAAPPQIERGWRHHLIDTDGRGYLDMVNNVAILGHGEPRLADAVDAQMRRLNTNSRFHYAAVVELSERLAALAPAGLDTVMLVNSGSEAVDLALRVVRAVTGRDDVLALTEAYHGWTVGADAVSTSLGDNPRALETRPAWVQLLDAPNTYRGTHRGPDAHRYLPDALARLEQMDDAGVALAGFIAEPLFGNGGGIALPDGYLAGVWEAVRARGGLCISDEVQVSYGRLGDHFWGFEQQGVVPDVITVAKAMGNGHPLGAVITTREIAEAFAVEGSFFSSAGGSPVSCVVGTTVLDVLEADGLQENARVVGGLLADGLRSLAGAHPTLGAIHGMGLYLGVEVIAGGPDDPDPTAAREICEALLDEGVIVQPTGDHKNVLKIKPPMTIDAPAVERFLTALDRVLTWRESRAQL